MANSSHARWVFYRASGSTFRGTAEGGNETPQERPPEPGDGPKPGQFRSAEPKSEITGGDLKASGTSPSSPSRSGSRFRTVPLGGSPPSTFRELSEPGLCPTRPLHPRRDRLQRLPLLVSKLTQLGLERAGRALGLRPLDPLPLKLFSGLRQGIPGRLPLGLDPRQLRFEPSDLLVLLRPEPLMLAPFPLKRLPLRLMEDYGKDSSCRVDEFQLFDIPT